MCNLKLNLHNRKFWTPVQDKWALVNWKSKKYIGKLSLGDVKFSGLLQNNE